MRLIFPCPWMGRVKMSSKVLPLMLRQKMPTIWKRRIAGVMWMQESDVGDGITPLPPLPSSSPLLSPSLQLLLRSLQSSLRSLQSLLSSPPLPLSHTCSTLSVRSLQMGKHNFPLHLKVNLPLESLCILFPIFHYFELRICIILISFPLAPLPPPSPLPPKAGGTLS